MVNKFSSGRKFMFCPFSWRVSRFISPHSFFCIDVLGQNHLGLRCKSLYSDNLPECMSGFDKATVFKNISFLITFSGTAHVPELKKSAANNRLLSVFCWVLAPQTVVLASSLHFFVCTSFPFSSSPLYSVIFSSSSPVGLCLCDVEIEAWGTREKISVLTHLFPTSRWRCCLLFFRGLNFHVLPFIDLSCRLLPPTQAHKMAWPFLEPVDTNDAPDYYRVIKEPMGEWGSVGITRIRKSLSSGGTVTEWILTHFLHGSSFSLGSFAASVARVCLGSFSHSSRLKVEGEVKSGLWLGHSRTFTDLSWSHCFVILASRVCWSRISSRMSLLHLPLLPKTSPQHLPPSGFMLWGWW